MLPTLMLCLAVLSAIAQPQDVPAKDGPAAPLAAGKAFPQGLEGPLGPFVQGRPFSMQQVFTDQRFPNVVVALDGSVVLTWGSSHLAARRSTDGGASFGPPVVVAESGIQGGGTLVDERSGRIFAFVEAGHPPAAQSVLRSDDHGATWTRHECTIAPDAEGRAPSLHMNEAGITLRHGEHAGRLLRATRFYATGNDRAYWPEHFTNAMYSDDGGLSWTASAPFPEHGTGEAAVAELSDGRVYYNSRVHWQERPSNTRRRRAISLDGGQSWRDWQLVEVLPDGHQHRSYGCMGGLTRLPVEGRDILLFSNLETEEARRERITVWASFDGGEHWPIRRLVFDGPSAYSSLSAGRPGTPSEGWAYLFFEGGPGGGAQLARFDLSWILGGRPTGDGELPSWAPTPASERSGESRGVPAPR